MLETTRIWQLDLSDRDHFLPFDNLILTYPSAAEWQRDRHQSHHRHRVIVRGNSVLPLNAAAVATMHQHLLSIRPECDANCGHDCATGTLPVAGPPQIDVPGGQAEWAVVPVLATGYGLTNEHAALAAAERLIFVPAHFWPEWC